MAKITITIEDVGEDLNVTQEGDIASVNDATTYAQVLAAQIMRTIAKLEVGGKQS